MKPPKRLRFKKVNRKLYRLNVSRAVMSIGGHRFECTIDLRPLTSALEQMSAAAKRAGAGIGAMATSFSGIMAITPEMRAQLQQLQDQVQPVPVPISVRQRSLQQLQDDLQSGRAVMIHQPSCGHLIAEMQPLRW